MYITETTENVRNLWKQLEVQDDLSKLKFLIYIFGLLNNNQINDKNEANPNLIEEDIIIFNLENIGFPLNAGTMLLQHFMMLYNNITKTNSIYEDNGNVIGLEYNEIENEMNSQFEKLNLPLFKKPCKKTLFLSARILNTINLSINHQNAIVQT